MIHSQQTLDTVSVWDFAAELRNVRTQLRVAEQQQRTSEGEPFENFEPAVNGYLRLGMHDAAIDVLRNVAAGEQPAKKPSKATQLATEIRETQDRIGEEIRRETENVQASVEDGKRSEAALGERRVAELLLSGGRFGGAMLALERGAKHLDTAGDKNLAQQFRSESKILDGVGDQVASHEVRLASLVSETAMDAADAAQAQTAGAWSFH